MTQTKDFFIYYKVCIDSKIFKIKTVPLKGEIHDHFNMITLQ